MTDIRKIFAEQLTMVRTDFPNMSWKEQIETAREWTTEQVNHEIGSMIQNATDDLGSVDLRKLMNPPSCQRCGTDLDTKGHCKDETCPFSDCKQDDKKGWTGHPLSPV